KNLSSSRPPRHPQKTRGASRTNLGKGPLASPVLALVGEASGSIVSGSRLGGAPGLPVVIAAPSCNSGDHQESGRYDIVAVALPQLLELFPAYFLIDFSENIRHEPLRHSGALRCPRPPFPVRPISCVSQTRDKPARIMWRHHSLTHTSGPEPESFARTALMIALWRWRGKHALESCDL